MKETKLYKTSLRSQAQGIVSLLAILQFKFAFAGFDLNDQVEFTPDPEKPTITMRGTVQKINPDGTIQVFFPGAAASASSSEVLNTIASKLQILNKALTHDETLKCPESDSSAYLVPSKAHRFPLFPDYCFNLFTNKVTKFRETPWQEESETIDNRKEDILKWFFTTQTFISTSTEKEDWGIDELNRAGINNAGIYYLTRSFKNKAGQQEKVNQYFVKDSTEPLEPDHLWKLENTFIAHPDECLPLFGLQPEEIKYFPRIPHIRESLGLIAKDYHHAYILMDIAKGKAAYEFGDAAKTALGRTAAVMSFPLAQFPFKDKISKEDQNSWISVKFGDSHLNNIFFDNKTQQIWFVDLGSLETSKSNHPPLFQPSPIHPSEDPPLQEDRLFEEGFKSVIRLRPSEFRNKGMNEVYARILQRGIESGRLAANKYQLAHLQEFRPDGLNFEALSSDELSISEKWDPLFQYVTLSPDEFHEPYHLSYYIKEYSQSNIDQASKSCQAMGGKLITTRGLRSHLETGILRAYYLSLKHNYLSETKMKTLNKALLADTMSDMLQHVGTVDSDGYTSSFNLKDWEVDGNHLRLNQPGLKNLFICVKYK